MRKITVIFGENPSRIERRALEELSKILLDYTLEYPVCIPCVTPPSEDSFKIYIGTRESNSYIAENTKAALTKKESYRIKIGTDTVIIEGYDGAGVLYGVLDFYNEYLLFREDNAAEEILCNPFACESLSEFEYTSAPSVAERGLWTWGHVIYDYRGYLDNMMRLKMNAVIIWNDFLPINADEIIDYAHERNIKVYWGFAWLWDTKCNKFDLQRLEGQSEIIFEKYKREFAGARGDGIYFQTFTELKEDNIDGVLIAKAAADFVNKTASLFYSAYPELQIQFGIHATSVKTRLDFIAEVDKRIRIVWEDCGAFPFSYLPSDIESFEKTAELVDKIATLRGNDDLFGVVTKGLVKLDWLHFEHQGGRQCIGVCSESMRANRVERKSRIWRRRQAYWLINSDKAKDMIDRMCRIKNGNLSIFALVEDGMFEENIAYPVALYSELLWNTNADIRETIPKVAMRDYVSFC